MILDDEKHFLKVIKFRLEKTGKYEIMTLLGAEDITSQVQKFKPDLICK